MVRLEISYLGQNVYVIFIDIVLGVGFILVMVVQYILSEFRLYNLIETRILKKYLYTCMRIFLIFKFY